jgi:hypothetical protein
MGRNPQIDAPDWWDWDLAFTEHLESRMDEREFSELEVRAMVTDAIDVAPGRHPGRYVAITRLHGQPWVVILEPDADDQLLWVVTAHPRDQE